MLLFGAADAVTLEPGWVADHYGIRKPAPMISCKAQGADLHLASLLLPFREVPFKVRSQSIGDELSWDVASDTEQDRWSWNTSTGLLTLNDGQTWCFAEGDDPC